MSPQQHFAMLLQRFFNDHLASKRDVSHFTISTYRDAFRLLLIFLTRNLGKRIEELSLDDLDAPNLLAFLRHLEQERGNSVRTVNCRLAALRTFLQYAAVGLEPDALPRLQRAMAIPFKRFNRPLLGYLTHTEIKAVLGTCGDSRTGRRDRLLLQILYNTGARVSEAIAIRVEDVQSHECKAVRLHGKGRKQRVVPLWAQTTSLIKAWLKTIHLSPQQPLLPNRFGQHLSRTAVQQRLSLALTAATAACPSLQGRRISPHTIRHTTAMHLLQAGIAPATIALWLGHENLSTTHQYIEADLAMKEAALNHLKPPKQKQRRYKPPPDLLRFLNNF